MRGESGQASVEWVGLVLAVALVLAALVALHGEAARRDMELGQAVLGRIACAARGVCGAEAAVRPRHASSPARPRRASAPVSAPPPSLAQATNAFRSLRGLDLVAKRTWILCLGYKRWRYELEHPRVPTEPFPVDQALQIANKCFNPLAFLGSP